MSISATFPATERHLFANTPETRSWISRKIESTSNQICRQVWQSQLWLREPPWGEDFAHWFQSRSRDWQLSLKRIWRVSWPATVMYDAAIVPRYFFPNAANLPRLVCWRNHKNYIGAFNHESGFSLWGSLEEYTLVWQSPTCRMIFDFFRHFKIAISSRSFAPLCPLYCMDQNSGCRGAPGPKGSSPERCRSRLQTGVARCHEFLSFIEFLERSEMFVRNPRPDAFWIWLSYFSSGPLAVLAPLVTSKSFTPSQELNPLVLCTLEVPSKSIQSPFVACVGIIFKASRGAWVTKCHRNLAFAAHAQAAQAASLAGGGTSTVLWQKVYFLLL